MSALDKPVSADPVLAKRAARIIASGWIRRSLSAGFWWVASVAVFAALWEAAWAFGWANPMLLPPPHIFLQDFFEQGRMFDKSTRLGDPSAGLIALAVIKTIGASTGRVLAGLVIAFVLSLAVGMAIRYSPLFGKLVLPMINVLAPISPVAWLPVAIVVFGIGDAPAIFLVFIALFFIMTLATLTLVDRLPQSYVHVARIMGATRLQIFVRVVLPAILPGLFLVLRLNLFAAWMVVLIAEAVGVRGGLGLVVSMARNTFDSKLAFFTMTVIGFVGFALDFAFRQIQAGVLYWVPRVKE